MSHPSPKWGTILEAADHLQVSHSTIRRMITRGEISARRFGHQIRVDMTTLDDAGRSVAWTNG